jgi:hypothetical protein
MSEEKYEGSMGSSYEVDDFEVVEYEGKVQKMWYIRAILDVTSSEFNSSELTNEKRIDIVNTLGVERMECILDESFKQNHKGYSAADEMALFIKMVGLDPQNMVVLDAKERFKLETEAMLRKAMSSR